MTIVEQLIEIQKQRGLTNRQFAETLGVHTISWLRNKRTRVIGADVLLRAFGVYPELREQFLASFTSSPEPSPNQKLGLLKRLCGYLFRRGK